MTQTRRLTSSAALLALALAVVTACSPGEETPASSTTSTPTPSATTPTSSPTTESPSTEPSETASPTETAASSDPPAEEPTPPEDFADFSTADQTSEGWPVMSGPLTYLTQVRAAAHDGYDRVVLELYGSTPPSYNVRYVDSPIAEGSGDLIDVGGSTFLRVDLARVVPPDLDDRLEGTPLTGPSDIGDAAISGLYSEGPWEGHSATHIGLDGARDFRVSTLTDPARIVVDIKR